MSALATGLGATIARSKAGRRLLALCMAAIVAVPILLVAVPVSMIVVMGSGSVHAFGGACLGAAPTVGPGQSVDGYGPAQLKVAATIITGGQSQGIDTHGQQIAVMVAMGESSLTALDHGDAADNTTIGVFQQGASYGSRAKRMNVATAASAFYSRMIAVPGWETMDPSTLGHMVQHNADPHHYTPYFTPAGNIVAALTGVASKSCAVPVDAKAAAAILVEAVKSGKLTFLENSYRQQIFNIATGTATQACTLDPHILQIMVIAVNNFRQVGVSDLNRRCTGDTPGIGTASAHWQGKAVDFYALNKRSLTGNDDLSKQLIHILDPYVPHGSGLGQVDCRPGADRLRELKNFTAQFRDSCDHQHIQVP
ncbi:hypothetical protein [Leifsonia sp. Root112D2]|uniref:hypothetical protein n=1 Tax=Leifsonia sp. Root112D2 TaxID=1736426 RepID=UPI0006F8DF45|nr:hypothetical protein [Leifsonia sp. Root112D2]KQV07063.1 hypothetical protein ASC63_06950 [Leifsonia sp. Root112D2]